MRSRARSTSSTSWLARRRNGSSPGPREPGFSLFQLMKREVLRRMRRGEGATGCLFVGSLDVGRLLALRALRGVEGDPLALLFGFVVAHVDSCVFGVLF